MKHRNDPGATRNMILSILGLVYYLFAMFISGINYVVACFVLYLNLYYRARKGDGDLSSFEGAEILVYCLSHTGCCRHLFLAYRSGVVLLVLF